MWWWLLSTAMIGAGDPAVYRAFLEMIRGIKGIHAW
jgi:hypothetical protein